MFIVKTYGSWYTTVIIGVLALNINWAECSEPEVNISNIEELTSPWTTLFPGQEDELQICDYEETFNYFGGNEGEVSTLSWVPSVEQTPEIPLSTDSKSSIIEEQSSPAISLSIETPEPKGDIIPEEKTPSTIALGEESICPRKKRARVTEKGSTEEGGISGSYYKQCAEKNFEFLHSGKYKEITLPQIIDYLKSNDFVVEGKDNKTLYATALFFGFDVDKGIIEAASPEALKVLSNCISEDVTVVYSYSTPTDFALLLEALKKQFFFASLQLDFSNEKRDTARKMLADFADTLKINYSLTSLTLKYHYLDDSSINLRDESISEALRYNKALKRLRFEGSIQSVKSMAHLAETLKINKTLAALDLSNAYIPNSNASVIDKNGTIVLCKALKTNNTLTELYLGCYRMKKFNESVFGEMLRTNTSLKILGFEHCSTIMLGISQGLTCNNSLTVLHLKHLTPKNIEVLCRALKHNKVLKRLKLCHVNLKRCSIRCFEKPLKNNNSLESLEISMSNIDNDKSRDLAIVVRGNKSLKELILTDNHIGNAGASALCGALWDNFILTRLDLRNNSISFEELKEWISLLQERNGLQVEL